MSEQSVELSPLQMKQLIYTKVRVELAAGLEDAQQYWAPNFDLDGVEFLTEVTTAYPEDQASDPVNFMVALRFAILNETEGKKRAPYTVDIHAQGWFELKPGLPVEKREDLVRVNGSSMILGAMREVISQLTARSGFGPLVIPTLRFLPDKKPAPAPAPAPES